MSWKVLVQAFFCGLFRLDKLRLGTIAKIAKVVGTLLGVGGAMLLTFYEGVEVGHVVDAFELVALRGNDLAEPRGSDDHLPGSLLALASRLSSALWLIIQAKMSDGFPYHYTGTMLMCFIGSIRAVIYTLCRERDCSHWKLGWNIRLLTVSYSGIVACRLCNAIIAWCMRMRGPLFVSVFNPLMLVVVALAGFILLDEKLHLGRLQRHYRWSVFGEAKELLEEQGTVPDKH
ncbi:WAT1-related protein At1g68170-like [Rhodamnia argentea]|uniref:WAT1-related protein n=1 Tax=Rhodamnia argentea TaxID=178133 RepID=A0ABM3HGE7_9MYRT|nr:WAT1-related protein At1g68170-like [Rhodamnia argentea]